MGTTWAAAQNNERRFWDSVFRRYDVSALNRLSDVRFVADHLAEFGPEWLDRQFLVGIEIGCGPSGILAHLPAERRVGIDPLADWYRGKGIDYEAQGYETVLAGTAEQASDLLREHGVDPASADLVVCCNTLDHAADAVACLRGVAALGSVCAVLLLCYDERFAGSPVHPAVTDPAIVAYVLAECGWECESEKTVPPAHDRCRISGRRYEVWRRV